MVNKLGSTDNDTIEVEHREISFGDDVKLSGVVSIPQANAADKPAVVMISGTGSVDRDGNVKQFKTNLQLNLSKLLTAAGFITLRYDKRGVGTSRGSYLEAGLNEFIADAVSAIRYLKAQKEVDSQRIIILGHSEGAFIAPAVYAQEPVNGMILLCGIGSPTKEILPLQPLMAIEEIRKAKGIKGFLFKLFRLDRLVQWQWDSLNKKVLSSNDSVIKILGIKKFNAKWFRETYYYNIQDYLPKITCPTLIIGGEKDVQCDPRETDKIAELIKGPCEAAIIPNMNHILCFYSETHQLLSLLKEYKQSMKNGMSADFISILLVWLKRFS